MMISPINEPKHLLIDQRDWDSMRQRLLRLEEEIAALKEAFHERDLLLTRIADTLARTKLG